MRKPKPEFSRVVFAETVRGGTHTEEIQASPVEREAVARRLGLESLEMLRASASFRQKPGGPVIEVEGRVVALPRQGGLPGAPEPGVRRREA